MSKMTMFGDEEFDVFWVKEQHITALKKAKLEADNCRIAHMNVNFEEVVCLPSCVSSAQHCAETLKFLGLFLN